MTPEQFKQLELAFGAANKLSELERNTYLLDIERTDWVLAQRLRGLLVEDANDDASLDGIVAQAACELRARISLDRR